MNRSYDDYIVGQVHELLAGLLRRVNESQLPHELHMAKRLLDMQVTLNQKPCNCAKLDIEKSSTPEGALEEAARIFELSYSKPLIGGEVAYSLRRMAWRVHSFKDDEGGDAKTPSPSVPIE